MPTAHARSAAGRLFDPDQKPGSPMELLLLMAVVAALCLLFIASLGDL